MQSTQVKYLYPEPNEMRRLRRQIEELEREREDQRREIIRLKRLNDFRHRIIMAYERQVGGTV